MKQNEKEEWRDAAGSGERKGEDAKWGVLATEVPKEIEIPRPVTFAPQDLPTTVVNARIPSAEHFVNIPATALSSPTLSISTVSDLTPTELDEEIEHIEAQTTTRHGTFYFEDGNAEIVCGDTVFRVHFTVISFASSKLRDVLSPSTLLNAPMPEGCPRIVFDDCAEDFAILLKMIYTPAYVLPPQI